MYLSGFSTPSDVPFSLTAYSRLQVGGHLIGQLVYVALQRLAVTLKLAVGLRVEGTRQCMVYA